MTFQTKQPYSHPPLKEVAFEVKFNPRLKVMSSIAEFQEKIADEYPEISKQLLVPRTEDSVPGVGEILLFENEKRSRIIRVAVDTFGFIVKDYNTFSEYDSERTRLWDLFEDRTGKSKMKRIGLRYINQLRFPYPDVDFRDHVKLHHREEAIRQDDELARAMVEVRLKREGVRFTIRAGVRGLNTDDKSTYLDYLLDYDCFQWSEDFRDTSRLEVSKYHDIIEDQFESDIRDSYREFMRTGKWK